MDYQAIFKLFCSEDELRPVMTKPFTQNGHYCAIDAYSAILLPVHKAEQVLLFDEAKAPDVYAVLPKRTHNDEILVSEIERQLIPDITDDYEECFECDEAGNVDVEYKAKNEKTYTIKARCPICDGEGVTPTGEQSPEPLKYFNMRGVYYAYWQLRRLLDACKLIGVDKITWLAGHKYAHGTLFAAGDFLILVMPVFKNEVDAAAWIALGLPNV